MNARRVFEAIVNGRASSRREVAEQFGLRSTTVSELVGELVSARLMVETTVRTGGRGRPTSVLVAHNRALGVVVFQVISQAIRASVVDLAGSVVLSAQIDIERDCDSDGMRAGLKSLLQSCLEAVPSATKITGVVFSLSGVLDVNSRKWLFSSRWPRVRELDLGSIVDLPDVDIAVMRNLDAELSARLFRHQASDGTLILHWGYGIGAAYAVEGNPVNAEAGRFGEIGHWRLNRASGRHCRCGRQGCMETVAALWAIQPALEQRWPGLLADEASFAAQARHLDLLEASETVEALDTIVISLANLCRILFPHQVIVSGPFIANPAIWARFNELFRQEGVLVGVNTPELVGAQRSEELELEGASRPSLDRALEQCIGGWG